jgi:hypothetical protein
MKNDDNNRFSVKTVQAYEKRLRRGKNMELYSVHKITIFYVELNNW